MHAEPGAGGSAAGRPRSPAPRSAHLPIDDALAPFADMLRQHLPTPDEIEQAAARRRRPRTARRSMLAVAAATALAATLWADPVLQRQTITTIVGERRTTLLADGSELQLNTASHVEVAQHLRSRRLTLEAGEASFKVSHAPWHALAPWLQRPFTVQAGEVRVEDIGTVFTVRRHAERALQQGGAVDVSVLQGLVRVHAAPGSTTAPMELGTGESLRAQAGSLRPLSPPALAAHAAWRDGWLVLDDTPLSSALAEMQRYRTAPLLLTDQQAGTQRISGQFRLNRLDQLLDLLPRLAPVQVHRLTDGSVHVGSVYAHKN